MSSIYLTVEAASRAWKAKKLHLRSFSLFFLEDTREHAIAQAFRVGTFFGLYFMYCIYRDRVIFYSRHKKEEINALNAMLQELGFHTIDLQSVLFIYTLDTIAKRINEANQNDPDRPLTAYK